MDLHNTRVNVLRPIFHGPNFLASISYTISLTYIVVGVIVHPDTVTDLIFLLVTVTYIAQVNDIVTGNTLEFLILLRIIVFIV